MDYYNVFGTYLSWDIYCYIVVPMLASLFPQSKMLLLFVTNICVQSCIISSQDNFYYFQFLRNSFLQETHKLIWPCWWCRTWLWSEITVQRRPFWRNHWIWLSVAVKAIWFIRKGCDRKFNINFAKLDLKNLICILLSWENFSIISWVLDSTMKWIALMNRNYNHERGK